MSKFLHYQFNELNECISVSELSAIITDDPNVIYDKEVKKLSKEEKKNALEKLGKKIKSKNKVNDSLDWE